MKRDFLIQSVDDFSERDCQDLQEVFGHPGSPAMRAREGTGARMALAATKLAKLIRGEEVG
jgi:hypothetical protein